MRTQLPFVDKNVYPLAIDVSDYGLWSECWEFK
jgi:hypothetical protein